MFKNKYLIGGALLLFVFLVVLSIVSVDEAPSSCTINAPEEFLPILKEIGSRGDDLSPWALWILCEGPQPMLDKGILFDGKIELSYSNPELGVSEKSGWGGSGLVDGHWRVDELHMPSLKVVTENQWILLFDKELVARAKVYADGTLDVAQEQIYNRATELGMTSEAARKIWDTDYLVLKDGLEIFETLPEHRVLLLADHEEVRNGWTGSMYDWLVIHISSMECLIRNPNHYGIRSSIDLLGFPTPQDLGIDIPEKVDCSNQ